MYDRVSIKAQARERLREARGACIGVYALYNVAAYVAAGITLGLGAIFIMPPLLIGMYIFFLGTWRDENPVFETLFSGFRQYGQSVGTVFFMGLFTFLWSLLFIIPGIIKALAYSMAPYLAADYPDMSPAQALKVSMAITKGHKGSVFFMGLSFFGWILLSGLTFGILMIVFVGPYMQVSMAGLYDALLMEALENGTIDEADLHS